MKKLDDLLQAYDHLPIPDDVDDFMEEAIQKGKLQYKRKTYRRAFKYAFATVFVAYLFILNTSPAFAKVLFKMPLIGDVSKILCVREYKEENDVQSLNVKVPVIENTGNKEMEDRVNAAISEHIDTTLKRVQKESSVVLETYRKQKSTSLTMKTNVSIDYHITVNKRNLLSFQIVTTYEANTSMQEHQIFNLDLKTGKELTLKELFGDSYKDIINTQIHKQIKERTQKDKNAFYFEGTEGFTGISDQQLFYIDDKNNVVIVFEKYEIAPGYMGKQEFKIPCSKLKYYSGD